MSRQNVETDKKDSICAMNKFLIDNNLLMNKFDGEKIYVLEKNEARSGLEYDLDMFADCDIILRTKEQQMMGFGVKMHKSNFKTFMFRYYKNSTGWDTEFIKLTKNINIGYFFPQVLVSCYYNIYTKEMSSLAMVKTRGLINFMNQNMNLCVVKPGKHESDGYMSDIIYIKWSDVPQDLFFYRQEV